MPKLILRVNLYGWKDGQTLYVQKAKWYIQVSEKSLEE